MRTTDMVPGEFYRLKDNVNTLQLVGPVNYAWRVINTLVEDDDETNPEKVYYRGWYNDATGDYIEVGRTDCNSCPTMHGSKGLLFKSFRYDRFGKPDPEPVAYYATMQAKEVLEPWQHFVDRCPESVVDQVERWEKKAADEAHEEEVNQWIERMAVNLGIKVARPWRGDPDIILHFDSYEDFVAMAKRLSRMKFTPTVPYKPYDEDEDY